MNLAELKSELKKAKAAANRAINKSDDAIVDGVLNVKAEENANKKIAEYNAVVEKYNAYLSKI